MIYIISKCRHGSAVARELSSGWGAQLTFANVVHDRKKPRVPPNLIFSSVGFRPLIFHPLAFSPIKKKRHENIKSSNFHIRASGLGALSTRPKRWAWGKLPPLPLPVPEHIALTIQPHFMRLLLTSCDWSTEDMCHCQHSAVVTS